jgi:trk system potassium uptake protein TrkA
VCLIAKKHSTARCIARVNNPKNKLVFESIDKENPITLISSTEVILDAINQHVNSNDYAIITKLKDGDLELVKLKVPPESPASGRRIVDIGLPRSSIVVAVDRKGQDMLIPTGDTTLQPGDAVILMVKKESRDDVRRVLVGPKPAA